jgi:hypothetical protein
LQLALTAKWLTNCNCSPQHRPCSWLLLQSGLLTATAHHSTDHAVGSYCKVAYWLQLLATAQTMQLAPTAKWLTDCNCSPQYRPCSWLLLQSGLLTATARHSTDHAVGSYCKVAYQLAYLKTSGYFFNHTTVLIGKFASLAPHVPACPSLYNWNVSGVLKRSVFRRTL